MATRQRRTGLFAAGALGGAVIVLGAWFAVFGDGRPTAPPGNAPVAAQHPPAPASRSPAAAASAQEKVAAVPFSASSCPPQPSVTAERGNDGRFSLEAALQAQPLPSSSAFLAVAREAAQQGRFRDAEVAFIAACRVAEQQGGSHSAPVADAKSQLGEHYVAMAARQPDEDAAQVLFQRATTLLSESADAFAVSLGKNASRTRVAERRVAEVRGSTPREAVATMPAARPGVHDPSVLGAARSTARELISSDPELAQLESDIGRLQAQASRVTRDPNGLQRRGAEAEARRDAHCEDKACLLRWYAQRRSQLLNEF